MTIKVPGEIRKKAEDLARMKRDEAHTEDVGVKAHIYCAACDSYLQCWKDLTAGEPDGWLLQNLKPGSPEFFPYKEGATAAWKRKWDQSCWQIVPVKLLRMEEK